MKHFVVIRTALWQAMVQKCAIMLKSLYNNEIHVPTSESEGWKQHFHRGNLQSSRTLQDPLGPPAPTRGRGSFVFRTLDPVRF